MTPTEHKSTDAGSLSLVKPVLIGGGLALLIISLFLSGVNNPEPAWGKLWMIRPLVIVPLAGAAGGLFFFFMRHLSLNGGLNKGLAIILSLLVYLVGLWLGVVLGLDGTLWD